MPVNYVFVFCACVFMCVRVGVHQTHVQFIRVFKDISTEHMELPAKLPDYFLRSDKSDKSNINQSLQRTATHCTTRTKPPTLQRGFPHSEPLARGTHPR